MDTFKDVKLLQSAFDTGPAAVGSVASGVTG